MEYNPQTMAGHLPQQLVECETFQPQHNIYQHLARVCCFFPTPLHTYRILVTKVMSVVSLACSILGGIHRRLRDRDLLRKRKAEAEEKETNQWVYG